jgi:hypothetical protein
MSNHTIVHQKTSGLQKTPQSLIFKHNLRRIHALSHIVSISNNNRHHY